MSEGLARNFLYLTAGNVLSPMFSMVLVLAISRLRGMEMLGQYSLLMTVFVVGQSCASLGLPVIVTREVARARERAGRYVVNASLVAGAVVTAALCVLVPAAWQLSGSPEMRVAMSLTLLTLLPSLMVANCEAALLAVGRAGDFVGVILGENVGRAGVGTVLVLWGFGVAGLAAAILVLRLAAAVVLLVVMRRRGLRVVHRPDWGMCRSLAAEVPVVGTIPIVNQLYGRSDVFLLTWLGTWRDVGLYSAGLRLVDLARTIPAAYGRALYPLLARQYTSSKEVFAATLRGGVRQVMLLVTPLAVVLSGFGSPLIVWVFGSEAEAGGPSLAVLGWTLVPVGLACVLAQALFAAGRQAVDLRVNLVAIVFSIAANCVMIPRFGALGAACAMLGAATLYAALQYRWALAYSADPDVGFMMRLACVAAVSTAGALALAGVNVAVAVGTAAGTYVVGVFAARLVTRAQLAGAWDRVVSGRRWLVGEQ